jgi:hypothetical protein
LIHREDLKNVYKETGQGQPEKKTGRKRIMRTKERIKKMGERFRRGGDQSVLKMAIMLDVSRTLLRAIVKEDFKLKPHKQTQPRLRKQQESSF